VLTETQSTVPKLVSWSEKPRIFATTRSFRAGKDPVKPNWDDAIEKKGLGRSRVCVEFEEKEERRKEKK
jgi:hypothetical protein